MAYHGVYRGTVMNTADPQLQGRVRVTARIGQDGSVVSAVVAPSPAGLPAEVVSCVVAAVRNAKFSPPEGGGATIVIPVTFVIRPRAFTYPPASTCDNSPIFLRCRESARKSTWAALV